MSDFFTNNAIVRWYLNNKGARQWSINIIAILLIIWGTQIISVWIKPTLTADMLYTSAVVGPQGVNVEIVESGDFEKKAQYTGTAKPIKETKVSARIDGYIDELYVYPGDRVEKGQLLLQIETSELKPKLKKFKANFNFWKQELKRDKELFDAGAIGASQFERTKRKLDVAKAEYRLIETQIGYARVVAPHSGYIAHRKIYEGDFIRKGMPLVKIVKIDQMRLQFQVSEQDLHAIRLQSDVYLSFPQIRNNLVSKSFSVQPSSAQDLVNVKAKVTAIFPEEDLKTRVGTVEVTVNNPDSLLKANSYVVANFITQKAQNSLLVPNTAILMSDDGQNTVFIAPAYSDEGEVEQREVVITMQSNTFSVVSEGLSEGEFVVTRGERNIVDGETVRVIKRKGGF